MENLTEEEFILLKKEVPIITKNLINNIINHVKRLNDTDISGDMMHNILLQSLCNFNLNLISRIVYACTDDPVKRILLRNAIFSFIIENMKDLFKKSEDLLTELKKEPDNEDEYSFTF